MKVRITFVLVLTLLACTAMASSHMEPTTLRQLDPLIGKFQCKGMAFASPMGPEHATVASVDVKWILGGQWAQFTYGEKKTTANPKPFTVTGFFGYDAEQKKYVSNGVDSMGGYGTSAADGWNGDEMVFVGPYHAGGMTMNGRDTFTKVGTNELKHMYEVEQNGSWQKMSQETCTRMK